MIEKICERCKKTFIAKRRIFRFCSHRCANLRNEKFVDCINCGQKISTRKQRKTCNLECYIDYLKNRITTKEIRLKISKSMKNHLVSKEARLKMSLKKKEYWKRKREQQ